MGSACTCQSTAVEVRSNRIRTQRMGNFTFQIHGKTYLEGLTAGTSCKRTLVWETSATPEQVQTKREEFWETRVDGNPHVWEVLYSAVLEPNSEHAESIIKAAGLKLTNGLMMQVYDALGHRYDVPPYIINEPLRYGQGPVDPALPAEFKEKTISFLIRAANYSDFALELPNSTAVECVKQKYCEGKEVNAEKARLFYNGKELKDGLTLGNYKICDGVTIQVLIGCS